MVERWCYVDRVTHPSSDRHTIRNVVTLITKMKPYGFEGKKIHKYIGITCVCQKIIVTPRRPSLMKKDRKFMFLFIFYYHFVVTKVTCAHTRKTHVSVKKKSLRHKAKHDDKGSNVAVKYFLHPSFAPLSTVIAR